MRNLVAVFLTLGCLASPAAAGNLLRIEGAEAIPGDQEVILGLYATHDDPIHAFSAAFKYDVNAFQFLEARLSAAGVVTGSVGYDYSQVLHDEELGHVIIGVVLIDFEGPYNDQVKAIPPSPEEPQLVAQLAFKVQHDAYPGDYLMLLRNGLGSPPIANVFSAYGHSVRPELESGTVKVLNPNNLYVVNAQAMAGGTASVVIEADHVNPIEAYQIVLRYPSDILRLDTLPLDDPLDPDPAEFVEPDVCKWPITWCGLGLERYLLDGVDAYFAWANPEFPYPPYLPGTGSGRLTASAIFNLATPFYELPPGRQAIARITFRVEGPVSVGDEIPITLVNGTGTLTEPVDNYFVVPIQGELPITVNPRLHEAKISIVEGFKRAHINPDAKSDLGDVIFILQWLFIKGPKPTCMDATDTNDDGRIDIADAVRLLGYMFLDYGPPPPPFQQCGSDPTPDNLGCDVAPGC